MVALVGVRAVRSVETSRRGMGRGSDETHKTLRDKSNFSLRPAFPSGPSLCPDDVQPRPTTSQIQLGIELA